MVDGDRKESPPPSGEAASIWGQSRWSNKSCAESVPSSTKAGWRLTGVALVLPNSSEAIPRRAGLVRWSRAADPGPGERGGPTGLHHG